MSHTAGCSGASIKTAPSLSVWSSSRHLIKTWSRIVIMASQAVAKPMPFASLFGDAKLFSLAIEST